ncbi:MAG: winged helix-turn-helix transcriptional regulator [Tissierellales bacterium]|jgi:DNA-binding MarR family transcriptional regulator|nr:winged helix-turn-helix transcriptional regulator [Tissierellales bacterium]MBN2828100.1 winged helix-turn-helix transcriptional regulator [Tissierellales bacterium]
MNSKHESLNKILVKLFNDILRIEEKYLCRNQFEDLTMTEFHIIETIGSQTERTMSETAKDLKITSGTLTIGIDNLVRKGYVSRHRSKEDKRIVAISLTDKGENAYHEHETFHRELVGRTLSDLEPDQEKVLIKALFNVDSYFKEKYKF